MTLKLQYFEYREYLKNVFNSIPNKLYNSENKALYNIINELLDIMPKSEIFAKTHLEWVATLIQRYDQLPVNR